MKILHIEDEPSWRDLISAFLDDHLITPAATLQKALELITRETFDLIICDRSIETKNDGIMFTYRLVKKGHEVVMLSGTPPSEAPWPCLSKKDATSRKALLSLIGRTIIAKGKLKPKKHVCTPD